MKIFSFNKLHSNEQLFKIQNMGIFLFHLPVVVGAGGWGGGGGRRREGAIRATCGPVIIYPLGEGVGGFWLCHNKNYLINLSCVVIFL